MTKRLCFLLTLLALCFLPNTARAADCDFTAVKESLYKTESSGSGGYKAIGPNTAYGKPLGKYQFIPPTQTSMLSKYPDCDPDRKCAGSNIINDGCEPTQECIMDRYLAENLDRVKKDPKCQAILNQEIKGKGQGKEMTCNATESGLLAGMHLGGGGVCRKLAPGGSGPSDNLGTSVGYYVCKHGGLAVPGTCTPPPYDPMVGPATLSHWQVASMNAVGQGGYISPVADPDKYWVVGSFMLMARQLTAGMMAQVQAIGMFFDAKHQLESQRLFQEKTAEAQKDYQPSEQMCTFGTFARDLAATERSANLSRDAFSKEILQRDLGSGDSKGGTRTSDILSRIDTFRKNFCNANDNGNGLKNFCPNDVPDNMKNRDIDFTRTLDLPLSLDINLTDSTTTSDETAVFALIDNLFAHEKIPALEKKAMDTRKFQYHYMNLRSIIAMRGVAQSSFANLIALKTATPNTSDEKSSAPYLRALLRELGLTDSEVAELLGKNPSYYAQMEILTKKIYQNPSFYAGLYDKPANVKRIRAAMTAIKLMQSRDIQASLLRREMLLSMLLELRLRGKAEKVYAATEGALFEE